MSEPAIHPVPGRPGTGPLLLVAVALVTVAMVGFGMTGALIGPIFLALTLALSVRPAIDWLHEKHGLPRPVGVTAVLLGMYAVLLGMVVAVASAVGTLVTSFPAYQDRFIVLYNDVIQWLDGLGVRTENLVTTLKSFDVTSVLGFVPGLLAGLSSGSTQLLTLLLALAFILIDTTVLRRRSEILRQQRPYLAAALTDFASRVRRYWIVATIFGLVLAVLDFTALVIIGVPMAFTWAVLAFVANYVPAVGFLVAVIPPTLLALLDFGVTRAIWVVVTYSVINIVTQSVFLPRFIGNAVGLGTTVTFISLIFWAGVIGPLGAILAVPLTLFARSVIIGSTPSLSWLDVFLQAGDDPPRPMSGGRPRPIETDSSGATAP